MCLGGVIWRLAKEAYTNIRHARNRASLLPPFCLLPEGGSERELTKRRWRVPPFFCEHESGVGSSPKERLPLQEIERTAKPGEKSEGGAEKRHADRSCRAHGISRIQWRI